MKYLDFGISSQSWRSGLIALLVISSSSTILISPQVKAGITPYLTAQAPTGVRVIYVNPIAGVDNPTAGTTASPYKTITFALTQAQAGTVIQLAPGSYTSDSGESFPLSLNPGVTLQGNDADKGQGTVIVGGGLYISRTFAKQNIAILANNDTIISGITVTNPRPRGTAIWVESSNPTIKNSTFPNSVREGIFVTGTGNPQILNNIFTQNQGNGISVTKSAQGEIRNNLFQNTGFGLALGGNCKPLLSGNQIVDNKDGLYISESAQPILRKNTIQRNTRDGIVVTINAIPDLGSDNNLGGNYIRDNGRYDLNNSTRTQRILAVGNDVDQKRIFGLVDFVGAKVQPMPTQTAIIPQISTPLASIQKPVTPQVSVQAVGKPNTFNDVPQGYWAKAYIDALTSRNIIAGFPDGSFRPNEAVTRAQFATIINKALVPMAKRQATQFPDITSSFWAYTAIQSAYQGKYVSGYPDGSFKPDQQIPRVQVLVSLANGLNLVTSTKTILGFYADAAQIPDYANEQVAAATFQKIVVNYPLVNQLDPNREATRAEIAAFVYQALVNSGRATAIPSQYLVKAP